MPVESGLKLYIVATPIGNLGDITYRAVETLKTVDLILCEDTRMTKRLLDHYAIAKPLLSYHQRSKLSKTEKIIELLESGKTLALVTDAGTPGISDPGNELVAALLQHFGSQIRVIPIPGAAAFTSLLQVAGLNVAKFTFWGFPPNKKGRETFFRKVLDSCVPAVYYESPYRFFKNLELLKKLSAEDKVRLVIGRELTKFFEEIKRGTLDEIMQYYQHNPDKVKGEFVVIVEKIV
jgi:16S rRNA (cytidine1402-2'-O)-methyltransferase